MKRLFWGLLLSTLAILMVYLGYLMWQRGSAKRANDLPVKATPPVTAATEMDTAEMTTNYANATATAVASHPVTSIQLAPVVEGLTRPVYLTHAFDDRLFVLEQPGVIRIIEAGVLRPDPFLDVTGKVRNSDNPWDEQGLLGLAFHPQYATNGRFFIYYVNNDGHTVLARYQTNPANANQADETSETILLTIGQPFEAHNGGQLAFGPDGYLYVGVGDGGDWGDPFGNGQNPATLLSTLLRLDVDTDELYGVPANNPFINDDDTRNEIWAIGLRNPWRFSFDRLTGDLFIADVGQAKWEELDLQPAGSPGGENYGWNIQEAESCYEQEACDATGLVQPILSYDHSQGCSITGGYVYRGQQFPELAGNYFFADFCFGTIWSLFRDQEDNWIRTEVFREPVRFSSFGEDVNGELYVLTHTAGTVYQIQPQ